MSSSRWERCFSEGEVNRSRTLVSIREEEIPDFNVLMNATPGTNREKDVQEVVQYDVAADHYHGLRYKKCRREQVVFEKHLRTINGKAILQADRASEIREFVMKHSEDLKAIDVILRYTGGRKSTCVGIGTTTWRELTKPDTANAGLAHFKVKFADLSRKLKLSEQQRRSIAFVTWVNPREEPDLVVKVFEFMNQGIPTFKFNEGDKQTKFFKLATSEDIRTSMGYRKRSQQAFCGVPAVSSMDCRPRKKQQTQPTADRERKESPSWSKKWDMFSREVNEAYFTNLRNEFLELTKDARRNEPETAVLALDFDKELNRQKAEYYKTRVHGDSFFDLFKAACITSLRFKWALLESSMERRRPFGSCTLTAVQTLASSSAEPKQSQQIKQGEGKEGTGGQKTTSTMKRRQYSFKNGLESNTSDNTDKDSDDDCRNVVSRDAVLGRLNRPRFPARLVLGKAEASHRSTTTSIDTKRRDAAESLLILSSSFSPLEESMKSMYHSESNRPLVVERMAKGGQSVVYRGKMIATNGSKLNVAIKSFEREDGKAWEVCSTELKILLKLPPHENVISVVSFFETPKPCYVMHLFDGGDLRDYLREHGKVGNKVTDAFMLGIARGLSHLARHNIVHRDIKPENVVLDGETLRPVLIDLGLSKIVDNSRAIASSASTVGANVYLAPEVLHVDGLKSLLWSHASDMYALGIINWELLTGSFPYSNERWTLHELASFVTAGGRPDATGLQDPTIKRRYFLVEEVWHQDRTLRPTAEEYIDRLEKIVMNDTKNAKSYPKRKGASCKGSFQPTYANNYGFVANLDLAMNAVSNRHSFPFGEKIPDQLPETKTKSEVLEAADDLIFMFQETIEPHRSSTNTNAIWISVLKYAGLFATYVGKLMGLSKMVYQAFRTSQTYQCIENLNDVIKTMIGQLLRFPSSTRASYDVFISHAGEQKRDTVKPLYEALSRAFQCFFDAESLVSGENPVDQIRQALSDCKYGIVVLSKDYIKRRWCLAELFVLTARASYDEKQGFQLAVATICTNKEEEIVRSKGWESWFDCVSNLPLPWPRKCKKYKMELTNQGSSSDVAKLCRELEALMNTKPTDPKERIVARLKPQCFFRHDRSRRSSRTERGSN